MKKLKSRIAFFIWRLLPVLGIITLLFIVLLNALFIYLLFTADSHSTAVGSSIVLFLFICPEYIIIKTIFLLLKNRSLHEWEYVSITPKDFPEYYNKVYSMCNYLKCPKIDRIGFDFSVGASFCNRRHIIFKRSTLILGVPILLLLNERELDAVVAHECGHYSKKNNKSSALLTSLYNIDKKIEKIKYIPHKDFTQRVLKWFFIQLRDYYFENSRKMELLSDQLTTKVASPQTLVNSLLKMGGYQAFLENIFWDEISDINNNTPEVPTNVFSLLEVHLQKNWDISKELFTKYLNSIKDIKSFPFDTHPSIFERAKALGAEIPDFEGQRYTNLLDTFQGRYKSALRSVFGEKADQILNLAGLKWSQDKKEIWEKCYHEYSEWEKRFAVLADVEQPTYDEKLEMAILTEKMHGRDKALEQYTEAKRLTEENRLARFHIGRILTMKLDEQGPAILIDVMKEDIDYLDHCCYHLVNYYLVVGDRAKAVGYYWEAVNFMKTNSEVHYERLLKLNYREKYIKCDLSYTTLNKIREELGKIGIIRKAYVVCRKAEISGDFPVYIVGIETNRKLSRKKSHSILNSTIQALNKTNVLPWEFIITILNGRNINIEFEMSKIEGSRII